ncbi:hypothetical protein [Sanguibacter massiliensis]|uniref:hypothetical protein n=1 Tax=Sanguibacter massiliensis TaxID=1973217 RepID=UPI000C82A951|nr:hypothetical protein [Sanguibacter massiliensis]
MVTLKGVVESDDAAGASRYATRRAVAFFGSKAAPCIGVLFTDAEDAGTSFLLTYEARVTHDWPRDGDDAPCRECGTR